MKKLNIITNTIGQRGIPVRVSGQSESVLQHQLHMLPGYQHRQIHLTFAHAFHHQHDSISIGLSLDVILVNKVRIHLVLPASAAL